MTQKEIDFTRAEQLGLLRRLPSYLDTDSREVSKRSICAVLRAVDEYANSSSGWCWASTETLSTAAIVSERTIRRAMRWLDDAGLITSKLRGNGMTKMTKIVWGNLQDLICPESDSIPVPSGSADSGTVRVSTKPVPSGSLPAKTDRPVATPDRPVATPDRPVATPDRPVVAAISGEYPVLDPEEHPVEVRQEKSDWVLVDRERVKKLAIQIREQCRCGQSTISTELIVKAAMLSVATDWNALTVARAIGSGRARTPREYLRGAIERAQAERGGVRVDYEQNEVQHG